MDTSNELFMNMRHYLAALSDAALAAFRPTSDMQRSAFRQEQQRRSIEFF